MRGEVSGCTPLSTPGSPPGVGEACIHADEKDYMELQAANDFPNDFLTTSQ